MLSLFCVLSACGPLSFWNGEHESGAARSCASGLAGCLSDVPSLDGTLPRKLLAGTALYDSTGRLVTGAATDFGAIDLDLASVPSGGGFFSSMILSLTTGDVCKGKSIFGTLGQALCPEEMSAGNAFRASGSLSLSGELAAGICTDASYNTRDSCEDANVSNVWTPSVASGEKIANTEADTIAPATTRDAATYSYASGVWTQASIDANYVCGVSGNIKTRINNCNRQWRATTGSKSGGGTWSLISRQDLSGTKYEVWRDEKTALIWSDNMGQATQCAAAGDNAPGGYCDLNAPITESVCAETGFAGAAITNIRGRIGLGPYTYDATKGGMGLNSANPVLWRLPTLQDYTTAYGNGMAYVLPRPEWSITASVSGISAMYFGFDSGGYVNVDYSSRNTDFSVRCVGR